ncbi:MAG: transporter substrate-binding domain-containing protein [Spirochaetaceae bacterium]|nr:transporter substrate-binding domain-containing protein [Spirochaetaceae bacterium]
MKKFIMFILLFISLSSILKSEEIDIMFNRNYYPFEFINSDGNPDGFTIDLIYAVARESTLTINLVEGNWKSREDLLFKGSVHISPGYLIQSDNPNIIISNPLFSVPLTLLYKKSINLSDTKSLHDRILILSSGDSSGVILSAGKPVEKIIRTKSWSDSLKALRENYGDYTIISRIHFDLMEEHYRSELKEMNNFELSLPYGFYSIQWNKNYLEKLNNGISIIKASGEFDRIYRKWFGNEENLIFKRADSKQSTNIYIVAAVLVIVVIIIYRNKRKVKS